MVFAVPLVIAGPSGVGKGTLISKLREAFPNSFGYTISRTSRPKRPNEQHGVHYYFVDRAEFLKGVLEKEFIEHAEIYGNLYGTPKSELRRIDQENKICLLEIDVQGVEQMQQGAFEQQAYYVFLKPPSLEELEKRLRTRNTEKQAEICQRLESAKMEVKAAQALHFDAIIINDDIDSSYANLLHQVLEWYPSLVTTNSALKKPPEFDTAVVSTNTVTQAQLHFASLGNWGTGSYTQEKVADTLKNTAKSNQITFVVSPGSNFLGGGIRDVDDPIWTSHFLNPYKSADLHIPFFTVLGEADWRGNFTALADRSFNGNLPSDKSNLSLKWTLPNWWYHYSQHFSDATRANAAIGGVDGSLGLIFIDTFILSRNFAYQNITELHWNSLQSTLASASKVFDWVIVVGDTALLSSGASKGDAELRQTLGKLLHDEGVDVYISGNDYNMEIVEDGPLTHINCGTGSKADSIFRRKIKGSIAYVAKPGFCHHIVTKDMFTTQLISGDDGKVLETYKQKRAPRQRSTLDRFRLYKELPEIKFIPVPPLEKHRPEKDDLFIRIVGTIGILVTAYLAFVGFASTIYRFKKETNR